MDKSSSHPKYARQEIENFRESIRQGPVEIKILTGSMHPVLRVGSVHTVVWVSPERLRRFDIVVFLLGNTFVCHYVWHLNRQIDPGTLVTRPLAGRGEDLPVPMRNVLGVISDTKIARRTRLRLLAAALWCR